MCGAGGKYRLVVAQQDIPEGTNILEEDLLFVGPVALFGAAWVGTTAAFGGALSLVEW